MREIIVSSTMPVINGNFEEIKTELTEQLKQFDLIVDEDSVKTAKSMATQINKLSKEIDEKRKQITKELSAPIKEFEAMMKELKELCQTSRRNLLSQAKVYDDKKLDRVNQLLLGQLQKSYVHYGVKQEYQSAKIDDLVMISNLTQGGALAKKAREAIDERVNENKKFQEKIDTRLLTLETICFKGGLEAPLARQNIESFLYEDDDNVYLERLTSLIANEVNRLREMEARKAKAEEQQSVDANAENKAAVNHPAPQTKTSTPKASVLNRFKNAKVFSSQPKMKKLVITATFEMEVKEDMNEEALKAAMLKKFDASEQFKMVPVVEVIKVARES